MLDFAILRCKIAAAVCREHIRIVLTGDLHRFGGNVGRQAKREREELYRNSQLTVKVMLRPRDLIIQDTHVGGTAVKVGTRMAADLKSFPLHLAELIPGQRL